MTKSQASKLQDTQSEATRSSWLSWLAFGWLFAFCIGFYSFEISNNKVSRVDLWQYLPIHLLELIDPQPLDDSPPSGWQHFPQRIDLLLTAGSILAGAWGFGQLVLRALRVHSELSRLERSVLAFGLGLSGLSLITLGCGLAGLLHRGLLATILALSFLCEIFVRHSTPEAAAAPKQETVTNGGGWISRLGLRRMALLAAVVPFLLAMLLGSMLPPVDFDVKEYHLQGPKEFYQAGRIAMLPHNVYTSFPSLTEMLSLLAMVLRGDWYWGALAGKAVLMSFAPLTALALIAAGRRWFSPGVGYLAALIHLTIPWTYRISIIAYAEGALTFYLFATLMAAMIAIEHLRHDDRCGHFYLLAGLLAGSSMACKYTGVVQVVIPLGAVLCGVARSPSFLRTASGSKRHRATVRLVCCFALGTSLTIGPWLLKNAVETGNPVYPLLFTVFGGEDWDPSLNTRWKTAHSPDTFALSDLGEKIQDVTLKSDWLSPLLFGLAPLAFLATARRASICWLWGYVLYLFCAWWALTHRIDRFWIPLLPVVSLLAAIGARWTTSSLWRYSCGGCIVAAVVFNLAFITTPYCGLNLYLADLDDAAEAAQSTERGIEALNQIDLPLGSKVLCVGAAQVFDARFPLVYNTVFDHSIFQTWCAAESVGVPDAEVGLRRTDEILGTFAENGITHVYVNWQEILRYRPTYGYTDFVSPARFRSLQERGILGRDITSGRLLAGFSGLSAQEQVERWAPELIMSYQGHKALIAMQVFPVLSGGRQNGQHD